MANIKDGNAFVAGRNVEVVRRLLNIAEAIKVDPRLVLTRSGGYEVPAAVADAYEKEQALVSADDAPKEPKAKATRTTRKTAKAD